MPSNQTPLGALPARFRRQRILIVGCGDVGQRVARALLGQHQSVRVLALTSTPAQVVPLRALGVLPLLGNLDVAATLRRLSGLATRVLHLAPPPGAGAGVDPRTTALARALRLRSLPLALVYGSTSGVYGDCAGARITETHPVAPATPRAQRRVDAERTVRTLGRAGVRVSILRIPGIYAPDREGGTPEARLRRGTPVLVAQDDVFTNHIHADDLARTCIRALWWGAAQRIYHASDDSEWKMGDYFDRAADIYGLARPPRLSRSEAQAQLPPLLLSFMSESRRLDNTRLHRELGLRLRYPSAAQGLAQAQVAPEGLKTKNPA
ncbi:MAG: sugar nucleotide-binding protein [Burkholderiaceae bacterium]|nr:sugar nucleotide-binding protein [Burkholderiaceae bacterium]